MFIKKHPLLVQMVQLYSSTMKMYVHVCLDTKIAVVSGLEAQILILMFLHSGHLENPRWPPQCVLGKWFL